MRRQPIPTLGARGDAFARELMRIPEFGPGVEAVTVCFRPREPVASPFEGYVVHGPHVVNFARFSAGIYHITLDKDYEADEVAIMATPMSAMDSLVTFPSYIYSGGMFQVPTVWSTGPAGEKNMRVVTAMAFSFDETLPGTAPVLFLGMHSDPITIVLYFLNRRKYQFRNPVL